MPGVDLGPVTVGALGLAVLTFFLYRSAQRVRALRQAGRSTPRAFVVLVVAYVVACVGYAVLIVSALRGGL